jgi:hypothetical protein
MTSKLKTLLCMRTIAPVAVLISSLFLSSLAAQADPLAYATTGDGQFGVVDLLTGVFTQRGKMGLTLSGLGEVGGKLYGGWYGHPNFYSVNPSTGALTAIGASLFAYWMTGSTTSGLFALDSSGNMKLYSINPNTGASTLIGPTGLSPTATVEGMSAGSDILYVTVNSSLYRLDTTTGAASLVGTSPSGLFGPMVVLKGKHKEVQDVIFSGAANPSAIWILNHKNGSGTFVADTTGADTNFYGLAPDND